MREKEEIHRKEGGTPTTFDNLDNTKVVRLKEPYNSTCSQCQQQRALTHQVETGDGRWGHVCQSCGEALIPKKGVIVNARETE